MQVCSVCKVTLVCKVSLIAWELFGLFKFRNIATGLVAPGADDLQDIGIFAHLRWEGVKGRGHSYNSKGGLIELLYTGRFEQLDAVNGAIFIDGDH